MPVAIHATEKALSKIFSKDFAFSIPAYQRPYAWTTEQASELLSDLLSFLGDESDSATDANPYFLGSIVLIKSEDTPQSDVVDGQQRLTTLTILLAVLRALLNPAKSSKITEYIYQENDPIEGVLGGYRLKLRDKDKDFFCKYIQDGKSLDTLFSLDASLLTDSQRNIQKNTRYFFDKLKQKSEQQLDQFIFYLMTRCFLVMVSTPDLDSAYRIFSVLNSRGLDLSLTDILKAEIIGSIPSSQQPKYTKIWENEEEELGRETFQELFAHIRMIFLRSKLREAALNEFRKDILPKQKPDKFIDDVLKPYSDALEIIKAENYKSNESDAKVINSLFRWLNKIDNVDWIPPAILYFSLNYYHPDKLKRFFTDLERLAAGLMISRADINSRISRYGKLLAAIEAGADLYAPESPLQLTTDEINRIVETLDGDLYLIKRISKYVLLRLDSAITDGDALYDYPVITIEHVLPQNPSEGSTWLQWFPTEEDRLKYVHRIGNLALLSKKKNSEASNYSFKDKKNVYFSRKCVVSFALTSRVLKQVEWNPETIEQLQSSSLQSLKEVWRL
jgi:uncharacterized protein with ParB-like and HNH nuclease domain